MIPIFTGEQTRMHDKRKNSPRGAHGRALATRSSLPHETLTAAPRKRGRIESGETLLRPITLTEAEAEAIVIGLATASQDDPNLVEPARTAVAKMVAASGSSTRARLARASANSIQPQPADWDELIGIVESAIRNEREIRILYADQNGEDTNRTIRPIALAESRRGESVAAWCNLRSDFRHFRLDRIVGIVALKSFFKGQRDRLLEQYMKTEGR